MLVLIQIAVFFFGKKYQLQSMTDVRNRADAFKMARTSGFWSILWILNFIFSAGFAYLVEAQYLPHRYQVPYYVLISSKSLNHKFHFQIPTIQSAQYESR